MTAQRFEYKEVYVAFRRRISVEGDETLIQEGERMTAFGRRVLNGLATQSASSRLSEPGERGIHERSDAFRHQVEVEHRFDKLELHHRQTAVDSHQIESRVE